jgi:hypothetical protein
MQLQNLSLDSRREEKKFRIRPNWGRSRQVLTEDPLANEDDGGCFHSAEKSAARSLWQSMKLFVCTVDITGDLDKTSLQKAVWTSSLQRGIQF